MTEPMFIKTDDWVYENQNGDIIDTRDRSVVRGFLFNGKHISYESIIDDELKIGEHCMDDEDQGCVAYPQMLAPYKGYSWINNFGKFTIERQHNDLYLYHYINNKYVGGEVARGLYI